jgi:hypothetical protein
MNLLIDLQYFAPIISYKISYNFSNIIFEQYENYQKMSFRNRCQIAGAEGVIELSVPLLNGRDQKTLMKDVRISTRQPWQAQHWKTIVSCYNRSPWFDFYQDELEQLYRRRFDFLMDWNGACFEWSLKALGLPISVTLTESYQKNYEGDEYADWRGRIMPKNRADIWAALWGDKTAGENPAEKTGVKPYYQVFAERTGFIPNLSILDLLFCEGKQAIRYVQSP